MNIWGNVLTVLKVLVVIDLDKKVLKRIVRKERIIRTKIWELNENRTRVRFLKKSEKTSKHRRT